VPWAHGTSHAAPMKPQTMALARVSTRAATLNFRLTMLLAGPWPCGANHDPRPSVRQFRNTRRAAAQRGSTTTFAVIELAM
jgi:hypothetical protein